MAVFRYAGNNLHTSLHGSKGKRGKTVMFRFRLTNGTTLEYKPKGKAAFDVGDEVTIEDARVIRHLKVDPRFELVSE
jgi:hypothetical protein